MYIAAIYLHSPKYLFQEPQTINFGGKYYYSFNFLPSDNKLTIERKLNESYIKGFFQTSNEQVSKLDLISAIVGQNGSGKSTIMELMARSITDPTFHNNNKLLLIIEDTETNSISYVNSLNSTLDYEINISTNFGKIRSKEITREEFGKNFQAILYSPAFDLKDHINQLHWNPSSNFLCPEKSIGIALEVIQRSNLDYFEPHQIILEITSQFNRDHINFLASDLYKNEPLLAKALNIPADQHPQIIFPKRKKAELGQEKSPLQFRETIKEIREKIEFERVENRKNGNFGTPSHRRSILMHFISESIISIIEEYINRSSEYLFEGRIKSGRSNRISAWNTLKNFLKTSKINGTKGAMNAFKYNSALALLDTLEQIITQKQDIKDPQSGTITVLPEDAMRLITLEKEFITDLIQYFGKIKGKQVIDQESVFIPIMQFKPTDRRLSSGEFSMLTFFSTLYSWVQNKLLIPPSKGFPDNIILLLDEADLGYHPTWKKKFINIIHQTLPSFFELIPNKPSIQIIFTTHDPLTLSDIPNGNIVFVKKDGDSSKILEQNDPARPKKTFGANISELLADDFFVEGGLIGDFAKEKINSLFSWLQDKSQTEDNNNDKLREINLVDEPIIKSALINLYDQKMGTNATLKIIEGQIKYLQNLKSQYKSK